MPTPERIPVTAGKKMASTVQNPREAPASPSAEPAGSNPAIASGAGVPPRKNDTSESAMNAMTTNCVFMASDAEKMAIIAKMASVERPTMRGSHPAANGNAIVKASVKPTV